MIPKQTLTVALVVIGVIIAWTATFAPSSPHSNRVALAQSSVKARVVADAKSGVATFVVQNGTSETVKIDWVETNCGCVPGGDHEGKKIPPRGSLKLDFHPDVPTVGSRQTTGSKSGERGASAP